MTDQEKVYHDLFEHTLHLLEEHDIPVEMVAGSLMAIAMRLYKTSMSEENFERIKEQVLKTPVGPYGKRTLH